MAASSNLIGNMTTVTTNGPAAATLAAAIAAAGPIMDYQGNCQLALLKLKEAVINIARIKTVTNAADTANLALINKLLAALNGTSTPSTTLLADIASVIATGPGAATIAAANAAAGPLMDYNGCLVLAQLTLKEVLALLTVVYSITNAGTDATNRGLIADIITALS